MTTCFLFTSGYLTLFDQSPSQTGTRNADYRNHRIRCYVHSSEVEFLEGEDRSVYIAIPAWLNSLYPSLLISTRHDPTPDRSENQTHAVRAAGIPGRTRNKQKKIQKIIHSFTYIIVLQSLLAHGE